MTETSLSGEEIFLTVFTPVYNRTDLLKRAYDSLLRQTDTGFEWVVVDDGSDRPTIELIERIKKSHTAPWPIVTLRQPNGGKHRAVNRGVTTARASWFMILDSDDVLTPDAVEVIRRRTSEISSRDDLFGFVALCITHDGQTIGTPFKSDHIDTTLHDYRHNMKIEGDRTEVVRTKVMREFPFPEIDNENFFAEGPIWTLMGIKYKARFTNDRFYIAEYQPEGLTARIHRLVTENPVGAAISCAINLTYNPSGLKNRIRLVCRWERRRRDAKKLGHAMHPLTALPSSAKRLLPLARMIVSVANAVRR